MATEIENINQGIKATPILLFEGIAVADGGQQRANRVQVAGIDADFHEISQTAFLSELTNNEIVFDVFNVIRVSENLFASKVFVPVPEPPTENLLTFFAFFFLRKVSLQN